MSTTTRNTAAAGESNRNQYETVMKPYGSPREVLALVRMGNTLHDQGEHLMNLLWAIGKLSELSGEFTDAMQAQGCPSYVNSGSLGALLIGLNAAAETMRGVLDETLEIGDLAGIGREGEA